VASQPQTQGESILNPLNNIRRGELKRILFYQGASKIKVHNMVEDIMAERVRWTAIALGRRMNLTFALKIKLGIRTIAAIDRTKTMMRLYFREQKRERDRRRMRKMRTQVTNDMSPRAKRLLAVRATRKSHCFIAAFGSAAARLMRAYAT